MELDLAGIIIMSVVIGYGAACPTNCFCSLASSGTMVNCSRKDLGYIPTNLPSTTYYLDLQINDITEMNISLCGMLPNLTELYISGNRISHLPDGYFNGCDQLTLLDLKNNQISAIKQNTFVNLTELKYLFLSNNKLQSIEEYSFVNLANLYNLDLNNNQISAIKQNTFVNLTELKYVFLSNNKLQSIEEYSFVNLANVYSLYLDNNQISVIKQNAFVNVSGPHNLELFSNKLQSIEEYSFVNMATLYLLRLDNNTITVIKQNAFVNLTGLRYLHLLNNKLQLIEENSFVNMANLYRLDLSGNPLNCDCSILPFWTWLTQLGASIIQYAKCSNGTDVISIRPSDLDKCKVTPTVSVLNQTYLAIIGENVTLYCNVTGYPVASNIWWTDSQKIRLNGTRYSGGNPSIPSLTIKNVIESDTGKYTCHATNTAGTNSQSTQIETGFTPYAEVARKSYASKTSEHVTLECNVTNSDTVHWYKDGIVITEGTKYNLSGIQNQDLIIIDVTPNDRGRYMCRATNKFGDSSDDTLLRIVHAHIPNSSYEKTVNESVTLLCLIYDATELKWRHNYAYIPTETGRYSGGNITVPSLTVTRLTTIDSGMYHCESSFESVISAGSGIELKIRDKPLVKTFEENLQASLAEDVIIKCSFDSYPEPTGVSWMKDGNILIVKNNAKYNGSTVQIPSLTIYKVNNADSGIYVCNVENKIGNGSGRNVKLDVQEPSRSSSTLGSVAGGISGGIVAVFLVVVVLYIYTKRKWTNSRQNSNYETPDDAAVELHHYDETQKPYITETKSYVYVNACIELASSQGDMNTTFKMYDAQDFIRILQDKILLSKHIIKEYEILNSVPMFRAASDYVNVDVKTGATIAEEYIIQALIKQDDRSGYIITTVPDQSDIDHFWTMIINNNVGCIVLLLQEVEKISEFLPNTIEPINTRSFKVEICSFDKIQNDISVFVLDISNKEENTVMQVRLYNITNWKVGEMHPSIDTMCNLLDVISSKELGIVAFMGRKGIGFPVSGNFGACHEVFHAIRNGKNFNILQIVVRIKHIRPDLFQTFEEYDRCYKIIGHFLENQHTYAVIYE